MFGTAEWLKKLCAGFTKMGTPPPPPYKNYGPTLKTMAVINHTEILSLIYKGN